ncbi:hypothetical protein FRC00_002118 [Tulasnella sp. 408]|nr:hypothetical protein FRC00_002118 [Tulasnella sp. 408]
MWHYGQRFTLAQDRFPQLCNLHLWGCSLPRDALPLNTLRILHLSGSWNNNLNEIIGFLKNCPEIEELTISRPENQSMWINSPSPTVRLEKLRRLELRNLEIDSLLHVLGFAKIPNFKQAIFTVQVELTPSNESVLQEILDALQLSSSESGLMELSVLGDAVTCTTQDGRSVEVRLPGRLASVSEECADTFLDCLESGTLRIAVELENQSRLRWLKQVLERTNVIELRVRLGCAALQFSRAVTDYLALSDEGSEDQTEGKVEAVLKLPLPSLQTLAFEDGMIDMPQLLRMVTSRVNGRGAASARIQKIALINCCIGQSSDLALRLRDLGVDLTLQ